ncbi:hypothetical protein COR50_05270 [Chitinophaga caeni]|uniref:DUF5077 domain-containing protein n=1 Tax=Chitinophaga caeni TaxID=2029983 RepID=A0A291QRQ3_9BACT|nr:DUF3472 domain-containing protein [Chitinophaga caeni]ATL46640.1 hypothetical protein COR50_05270 [Chitinophaga caeni]
MKKQFLGLLLLLCSAYATSLAQSTPAILPGFTAYAAPAEEGVNISQRRGVVKWNDANTTVHFYCHISNPGSLKVILNAKADAAATVNIAVNGENKNVEVPVGSEFSDREVLKTKIKKAGFYDIAVSGVKKSGDVFADINSIKLEGSATKNIQFNPKPWRRSASVHLNYTPPAGKEVEWFYGEIKVPEGEDKVGTYFMSCGFHRGYFGMQVNSPTERRIIFSVWDAGGEPETRDNVKYEDQVRLLAKGDSVVASGFGGEGTGGHSHWLYNWKAGNTYKFLMHSVPEGSHTTYTAYFFVPEHNEWKLIASFRAPKDGKYMGHLYSFLENFSFENGNLHRKGFFGNHWIKTPQGEWYPLNTAKFTNDATARANDRLDYGGGADGAWFYLWTSGFIPANAQRGDMFEHTPNTTPPVINLPKF